MQQKRHQLLCYEGVLTYFLVVPKDLKRLPRSAAPSFGSLSVTVELVMILDYAISKDMLAENEDGAYEESQAVDLLLYFAHMAEMVSMC